MILVACSTSTMMAPTQASCPVGSWIGREGCWEDQPATASAIPPAMQTAPTMKQTISKALNVQSLRILRLTRWTMKASSISPNH